MKFVVFSLLLVICDLCTAQEQDYYEQIFKHREEIDLKFADEEKSPLKENDLQILKPWITLR